MKRLIIALALLITPSVSKAEMFFSKREAEDISKTAPQCANIGKLAEGIMHARQAGKPMSFVMQVFAKEWPEAYDQVRFIVIEAYERNQHSSDDMRKAAIKRFREVAELGCYKREEKHRKNNHSPTD